MAERNRAERLNAAGLQRFFEGVTDRLRSRGPRRVADFDDIIPVQVDLVGGNSSSPAQLGSASSAPAPTHPFLRSTDNGSALQGGDALQRDWSFRETVVLQRSRRGSRVLLYTALGLSAAGATWLLVAPLNETVLVQGKLEPDTKVKLIQTPVPGVIDQVLVEEGSSVRAGQVLLRFDLRDVRNQLASAEAIKRQLEEENATYAAALGEPGALSQLNGNQRERLNSQREELLNRRQAATQQLRRSEVRVEGLRQSAATASNIADRYERLVRSGAISEVQLLEARNKARELSTSLAEEEREVLRLQAEVRSSSSAPSADLRGRIEANRRLIAEQEARISTTRQQLAYGELKAPSSGVVFDLEARRGTVAQAGQNLLRVVPDDALQARVYLPSNVIGFIKPGQLADISLDTFPATDYGRLPAVVKRVGTDALTAEKQKEALGTESTGLHYPAILRLQRQTLQAGSKRIPLQPGMSLSADIQLRQRRMISLVAGFFEDKLRSLERIR
jgi:hemolysin D